MTQFVDDWHRSARSIPRADSLPRLRDAARPADHCRVRADSPYFVTRERIRTFAGLTHNDHPIHRRDAAARDYGYPALAAPPTFAALIMIRAQQDAVRILAPSIRHCPLLHTRQTLDIRRLLVAGDIVTTDIRIDSVRTTTDYACVEAHLILTDRAGEIVQSGSSSLHICTSAAVANLPWARRDSGRDDTGPTPPRARITTPDSTGRGLALPRRLFRVERTAMADFAALGHPPRAPLGPDPGGSMGPPTGMMRLALAAGYLSSVLGDPAAVYRYEAEFTHFEMRAGRAFQPVEISGRLVSVDETAGARVELDGRCLDRRMFIRASAALRPPGR
ncbi:FAS1-like dehydratase domain-containing protein [Nocardia sp. NPDC003963]